jgi:hypothetical protein
LTTFNQPISEIIRGRFSCRSYLNAPLDESKQAQILLFIDSLPTGPFGSRPRFMLVAASEDDRSSLRGLGTYGFIQGANAFVIGAAKPEGKWLEDFGCLMETIILYLTNLGLGTCWLGGSFTRSSFGSRISLKNDEHIPTVTATGEFADPAKARRGLIRRYARGEDRLPWKELFFDRGFDHPLPWRIVKDGDTFHFYLQRTPGYRESLLKKVLGIFDLQRVDMGIAMCHFALAEAELGHNGEWQEPPTMEISDPLTEYTASWVRKA